MGNRSGHITDAWRAAYRENHISCYPALWEKLAVSLACPAETDGIWVAGASFYILELGGMRIAIDPIFVVPEVAERILPRLAADFRCVDAVLLTHDHADHYDPAVARALAALPVLWIVPECMRCGVVYPGRGDFLTNGLPPERIRWVEAGDRVPLGACEITVTPGLHHYDGGSEGPDSVGYLVACGNKRVLFPSDVRDFRPALLPEAVRRDITLTVAHIYLGGGSAMRYPFEEYLEPWVNFYSAIETERIMITHLYEWSSPPGRFWSYLHGGAAMDGLYALHPEREVILPCEGRRYPL